MVGSCQRAPDYESGGQEFESLRARQKNLNKIGVLADVNTTGARQLHWLSQQPVSASRILLGRPHLASTLRFPLGV
jgi:hypothetical protein